MHFAQPHSDSENGRTYAARSHAWRKWEILYDRRPLSIVGEHSMPSRRGLFRPLARSSHSDSERSSSLGLPFPGGGRHACRELLRYVDLYERAAHGPGVAESDPPAAHRAQGDAGAHLDVGAPTPGLPMPHSLEPVGERRACRRRIRWGLLRRDIAFLRRLGGRSCFLLTDQSPYFKYATSTRGGKIASGEPQSPTCTGVCARGDPNRQGGCKNNFLQELRSHKRIARG